MTKTSSFGTTKREGHDSTSFYARNLLKSLGVGEKKNGHCPEVCVGDWANKIYCADSRDLSFIPDETIALTFTSPPYGVGKDYDQDLTISEYMDFIYTVGMEVYRTLIPGGRYVINIANLGRKPYIPMNAFFYGVHNEIGFLPFGEVIWQKGKGANNSCAWGSWMSAKAPRLRDLHEYLLIFAKDSYSRYDKGFSDIPKDEFMRGTLSVWEIPPASAKRIGHPAPFPLALAKRVIKLFSYVGDVILDPFVGSGTTCVAATTSNRHFVGVDNVDEYCELAEKRLLDVEDGR